MSVVINGIFLSGPESGDVSVGRYISHFREGKYQEQRCTDEEYHASSNWYTMIPMSPRQPFQRSARYQQYRLVGRRAVPCEDLVEWGEWFATADRRVAETWIDDIRVSTVFLGLDHNLVSGRDPAFFETMVFVAGESSQMRRYFIWEEAEAGQAETVAAIRAEMDSAHVEAVVACRMLLSGSHQEC